MQDKIYTKRNIIHISPNEIYINFSHQICISLVSFGLLLLLLHDFVLVSSFERLVNLKVKHYSGDGANSGDYRDN